MSIPDIQHQQTSLCRVRAGQVLDVAWQWLCDARKDAPANAGIWHLRYHWHRTRDVLLTTLLNGDYRLQPMLLTKKRPLRDRQVMWGAQDALVLKWTALLIAPHLELHPRCEHVKGHGGGPQSVHRMADVLINQQYNWVCRTDVKGYYRHINRERLMNQVIARIADPVLQDLVYQYLHYTVEDGGEFHTPESGIARGCALSPLMGALHLYAMDAWFAEQTERTKKKDRPGIYYARYMDDIVILAHTRWQLRKHVRALNQFFNEAGFCQHPDKTFIGRTERGFDWMGAQMSDVGVEGIAHRARANHLERLRRLYERVRRWPAARRQARMSQYRKRWIIWAVATVGAVCASDAVANIGTASDLQNGLHKCINDGSLATLPGGEAWGGSCDVYLTAGTFASPANGGRGIVSDRGYNMYGEIWWPLQPSGQSASLTISNTLTIAQYNYLGARKELASFPAGSTFYTNTGTGTPNYGNQEVRLRSNDQYRPPHPQDARIDQSGNDGDLRYDSSVGGTLHWTLNVPVGSAIKFPNLNLMIGLHTQPIYYASMTIGVGGAGGIDPTPPDPPVAGDPPNCTAWQGVSTTTVSLGNATPGKSFPAELQTSLQRTTPVGLTCTSGPSGSLAAKPYLTVTNKGSVVNTDGNTLTKQGDWLGLRLKLPSSPQGNGHVATGQTAGGYVKWNGTSATRIWDWDLPAVSALNENVPVSQMVLTPEIWQTAARGTTEGTRSYQVEYAVVLP